jgi:hypothetical protein
MTFDHGLGPYEKVVVALVDELHEVADPSPELLERTLSDIGVVDIHDGLRPIDRSVIFQRTSSRRGRGERGRGSGHVDGSR